MNGVKVGMVQSAGEPRKRSESGREKALIRTNVDQPWTKDLCLSPRGTDNDSPVRERSCRETEQDLVGGNKSDSLPVYAIGTQLINGDAMEESFSGHREPPIWFRLDFWKHDIGPTQSQSCNDSLQIHAFAYRVKAF